jgi:hypothetical protein
LLDFIVDLTSSLQEDANIIDKVFWTIFAMDLGAPLQQELLLLLFHL